MKSLIFLEPQYKSIKEHLFPGDGLEALSICLAKEIFHSSGTKLIVTEVHNIPHEKCDRSDQNLTWATSDLVHILERAEDMNLSIIKIHSHPGGYEAFSMQDDRSDRTFFPSLQKWFEGKGTHCSVIFTEDFILGRTLNSQGAFEALDKIFVIGDSLRLFRAGSAKEKRPLFDEESYEVFKDLKIGVIGCSGTGSWIAELLGRNCVGELVLCDHDILKPHNLTRILNSKMKDCGMYKAEVVARSIREMGLGTKLTVIKEPLQSRQAINALKGCDIIFGCTDSVLARYCLSLLSTYFCIPYFDIGVFVSVEENAIAAIASGYHYLQPGKSSLQSRGVFSAEELEKETFKAYSPDYFHRLEEAGYVRGHNAPRPAVIGTNGHASVSCFEEFQSQILSYRDQPDVLVASRVFCGRSGEEFLSEEKEHEIDLVLKRKLGLTEEIFEMEKNLIFLEVTTPPPKEPEEEA